jgi:choline-glycine betaine transporter
MIDIIFSFFLVVTYFIIYLFSSGENKQQAKENLKEVITGADGKLLLITVMGILIVVIYLYFYGFGL